MPRKCANGTCKKVAILRRPKTEPMVLPEESSNLRGVYGQYAKENLEKALKAVKEDGMSCCKASKTYGVPRSTLKNYLQDRSKLGVKSGRRRSIPEELENDLVDQAISASVAGFSITKKAFLLKVSLTAKKLGLETQFKNGIPGNDYWRALKSRRPDLARWIRKSDNKNINLKKNLKSDTVSDYFEQLESLLSELNLLKNPSCIWNAGEVGIQYCAEPVKLLPKRGTREVASMPGIHKETLNAVLSVSALGTAMPPFFVVTKGDVRTIQKFTIHNSSGASVWGMQESEWKSEDILVEWFKEVFLKNCGPERPQVLIMNNYGSQEMLDLLAIARTEGIHILSLPACSSPWLEPLDRGIFVTFQKCCRRFALQFMIDNPTLEINHDTWPNIMCMVWDEVMQSDVITRAFDTTGIYPLNKSKIPRHAVDVINKEHNKDQSTNEDSAAAASISSQQSTSNSVQKTFYHFAKVINPPTHNQPLSYPSLPHQQIATSGNPVISCEGSAVSIHPHQQIGTSSSSTHSVIIMEDAAPAQVYTPVSNPSFMTSSDPASMFPVFNG